MPGPLQGVRVVDLTTVVMGPFATQILGDLGADVVKVEAPSGDHMRWIGPSRSEDMGPLFTQANRNKRGVVLDLKEPGDRDSLRGLLEDADVFVSNVRSAAMSRLGLDYTDVKAINSTIIYCSAVGYGSDGPLAGRAVYDDLMQAESGICGLFASVDGAPRYAPINVCDRVVGLYLVIGVLSALHQRQLTGSGQQIEIPMFETMAQFVLADHMGGHAFDPPIGNMGYQRLLSRTRGPYPTADGYLSIVVYTDQHWRRFSALVGRPDLLDTDERFASPASRTIHAEALGQFLTEHMPIHSTATWMELLDEADIPVAPVNGIEDLISNPHLASVDMFEEYDHPTDGAMKFARFPVSFSGSTTPLRRLPPRLGEHTDTALRDRWTDETSLPEKGGRSS